MHKLIAKIARLAVSKAAAFGYAVGVGVAGNLAFNFVQQHHQPAAVVAAPEQAATSSTAALPPLRAPGRLRVPATSLAPIATAPILPNPQPVTLPGPDALPTPALKPAALPVPAMKPAPPPPRDEAALPAPEDAGRPHLLVVPPMREEAAKPSAPVGIDAALPATTTAAATSASPPAALPPLGPAVDVLPPPEPPRLPARAITGSPSEPEVASSHRANLPAAPASDRSLELSDIWHPGRVVKKGLHWAGDRLPVIGGAEAEAEPQFPRAGPPPAAPIPLLPPATQPTLSENTGAPGTPGKPAAPGPGSGGLY